VLGRPCGSRIITAIFQVLLHVVDHGMPVDEAVAPPCASTARKTALVHLEPGWPDATRDALAAFGCHGAETATRPACQAIGNRADGTPGRGRPIRRARAVAPRLTNTTNPSSRRHSEDRAMADIDVNMTCGPTTTPARSARDVPTRRAAQDQSPRRR
jgi:hypothetical protein